MVSLAPPRDRDDDSAGARNAPTWRGAAVALASVLVVTFPAWLRPRLIAEEGLVYLGHALRHSFGEALVAPHFSYLALLPNAATAVAAHFPLGWAPLVTTALGIAVQGAIGVQLATSSASFLDGGRRWVALGLYLGAISAPLFLANTWPGQYLMVLPPLLILCEPAGMVSPGRLVRQVAAVLGAGLCGVLPTALAPLFALRALATWRRPPGAGERLRWTVLAAALVVGAGVQASLVLGGGAPPAEAGGEGRTKPEARAVESSGLATASPDASMMPQVRAGEVPAGLVPRAFFWRMLVRPLLGPRVARAGARRFEAGSAPWHLLLSLGGVLVVLVPLAAAARRSWPLAGLLAAGALHYGVVLTGAVAPKAALIHYDVVTERYFVVPHLLLGLALLEVHARFRSAVVRGVAVPGLALLLVQAVGCVLPGAAENHPDRLYSWRAELSRFEAGEQSLLRTWPPPFVVQPPWRGEEAARAWRLDPVREDAPDPRLRLRLEVVGEGEGAVRVGTLSGPPGRQVELYLAPRLPRRLPSAARIPGPRLDLLDEKTVRLGPFPLPASGSITLPLPGTVGELRPRTSGYVGWLELYQARLLADGKSDGECWSWAWVANADLPSD